MPPRAASEVGPEWAHVRVTKKGASAEEPEGAVGTAADKARCLHCGASFSAQAHRIRAHLGCVSGRGVTLCAGPTRRAGEAEASSAERFAAWKAVKCDMSKAVTVADAAASEAASRSALERATSGGTSGNAVAPGQRSMLAFGKRKRSSAQERADKAGALALTATHTSWTFVEDPFVQQWLKEVRSPSSAAAPPEGCGHGRRGGRARCVRCASDAATRNPSSFLLRVQVAACGPAYVPPRRRRLARLLPVLKAETKDAIKVLRLVAERCGETLTTDGATDVKSRPILNLMSVTPGCGSARLPLRARALERC